jgi:hypothetical protein
MTLARPMFPPRAGSVDSFPPQPGDTSLSASRTPGGDPVIATSIPVVDSPDIRRGDSGVEVADPATITPPALTSRRGFLMNTMVSAASIATATALTASTAATADSHEAVSLASEILRLNELAHQDDDEIYRLCCIWRDKLDQLRVEGKHTQHERWEMAMPESMEHTRLIEKTEPYFSAADKLVKRLWSLPANTAECKRAKVRVLFKYFLTDEKWHKSDEDADWDVEMTRKLLFELSGTSNTEILGDHADYATARHPEKADPIFAAIAAARVAHGDLLKTIKANPDDDEAIDEYDDAERLTIEDLIWTMPTTAAGLAALLGYCRERETINELIGHDEKEDVLEWTMECAACALAGLPKPPMSDVVADAWESRQEDDASEEATTA